MNDEQFQRWLDQHGGEVGRKNNEKTIDGPADPNTGTPTKQTVIDTTTITAKDGATITLRRQPGPINNGQDYEVVATEPPKPVSAATTGSTDLRIPPGGRSETQGTPIRDANGTITGWDNNRPRRVVYDKDGNVVGSQELEGPELTAWRSQQQANQPQTGEVTKDVPNRPGWRSITRTTTQGGNKTETTVYVGPDGKEVPTLPEQPKDPTVQIVPINGQRYQVRTTPGASGQPPKVEWLDPSGNPIAKPPVEASKPHVETATINGQRYTSVTTVSPDGAVTVQHRGPDGKEVTSLPTEGQRQLPSGMPTLDTSTAEKARQSYLAQVAWVQQQVTGGTMSSKEAIDLLTPSKEAADSVIKAEQDRISNERQTRTQDIQQEGNRLSASTAQFANSRLGVDEIAKYAPRGGTQAGTAYLTNLLTQGLMNQGTRGNVGAASPTPQSAPLPNPNALSEIAQPGDPPLEPTGSAMLDGMAARAVEQARAAAAVGPDRATEIRGNPVFRPTAPVGSPVFQNSTGTFGLPDPAPATPPAVQGTPSPLGDTGAPPVSMMDPSTLPPFLRNLYGRSVLDQILGGGYA